MANAAAVILQLPLPLQSLPLTMKCVFIRLFFHLQSVQIQEKIVSLLLDASWENRKLTTENQELRARQVLLESNKQLWPVCNYMLESNSNKHKNTYKKLLQVFSQFKNIFKIALIIYVLFLKDSPLRIRYAPIFEGIFHIAQLHFVWTICVQRHLQHTQGNTLKDTHTHAHRGKM